MPEFDKRILIARRSLSLQSVSTIILCFNFDFKGLEKSVTATIKKRKVKRDFFMQIM